MAIHFQCTECDSILKIKDKYAGKSGKCPECKSRIQVPESTAAPKPTADDEEVKLDLVGDDPPAETSSVWVFDSPVLPKPAPLSSPKEEAGQLNDTFWVKSIGDGNVSGPLSFDELDKKAQDGWLKPADLVSRSSTGPWTDATSIDGLEWPWRGNDRLLYQRVWVAGVNVDPIRQKQVRSTGVPSWVYLGSQPSNKHDSDAIAVMNDDLGFLGYIPNNEDNQCASWLKMMLEQGHRIAAFARRVEEFYDGRVGMLLVVGIGRPDLTQQDFESWMEDWVQNYAEPNAKGRSIEEMFAEEVVTMDGAVNLKCGDCGRQTKTNIKSLVRNQIFAGSLDCGHCGEEIKVVRDDIGFVSGTQLDVLDREARLRGLLEQPPVPQVRRNSRKTYCHYCGGEVLKDQGNVKEVPSYKGNPMMRTVCQHCFSRPDREWRQIEKQDEIAGVMMWIGLIAFLLFFVVVALMEAGKM